MRETYVVPKCRAGERPAKLVRQRKKPKVIYKEYFSCISDDIEISDSIKN